MKTITIHIKNMVCPRCIHVVQQILSEIEIPFTEVGLGYATLKTNDYPDLDILNRKLEQLELGLIRDQNELLVTEINKFMRLYLENISTLNSQMTLSNYISKELGRNYHQLSKIYRKFTGITIEQRFIELRTNKVKELIKQGNLNMSQIAITVGYSTIHYLSGQFRKYTGVSLTDYRKKWEDEVRMSFERTTNDQIKKEECNCGSEGCHCLDEESEQSTGSNRTATRKIHSGDFEWSSFNPMPRKVREFRAYVSQY